MYASLARLQTNSWFNGTSTRVGVFNSTLSNADLRWERTESINIGVDLGLFENKLDLTLDYYDRTTTDVLMNRLLPIMTGFNNITSNLGELGNKGFEATLNTVNLRHKNFTWRSNLVFSLNRNKIKKLFGDTGQYTLLGETRTGDIPDYSNQWFPGQAVDVVWDYKPAGVWQVDEAEAVKSYNMRVGDFKSVDVNGDGKYTDLIDKQFIGFTQPRYRLGLRNDFTFLTNFTASVFVRSDLGHIDEYTPALNRGWESNDRRSRDVGPVPYWTPENPINDYARLDVGTSGYGGGLRIYKPRSFVRIQDVSLSYNLPSALTERVQLNNFRVFASVRNLATFTKWPHWDPESGDSPMPKTYTMGLSLSL
jgi:TonB-dependent starch-binding outer membrane protein SusC